MDKKNHVQGRLNLRGDITARKSRMHDNSVAASKTTDRERDCKRILEFLRSCGFRGATCYEISQALGMPYQTASGRCADLKLKLKLIIENGAKRPTNTGSSASVLILKNP